MQGKIVSELQEYFDDCDHNEDGRIQYEDFLAACSVTFAPVYPIRTASGGFEVG